MPKSIDDFINKPNEEKTLYGHKYAIHFDILSDTFYLNTELPILITDILQLLNGFPDNVWFSQKTVDEGLDFCRLIFWVFSDSSDALKTFGIWFQAIFRESRLSQTLERIVIHALDQPEKAEVELTDWTRLHTTETDIQNAIQTELIKKCIDM